MSIEEFTKSMMILNTAYGKDMNQEQLQVWYEFFKDINIKEFQTAIKNLVIKNKFFPTVADIREEIVNINSEGIVDLLPEEEWKKVLYCIRHFGPYKMGEIKEYLGEVTYNIAERFCWEDLFNLEIENTDYIGDRFIKFYQANQKNYKTQMQLGNSENTLKLNNSIKSIIHKID